MCAMHFVTLPDCPDHAGFRRFREKIPDLRDSWSESFSGAGCGGFRGPCLPSRLCHRSRSSAITSSRSRQSGNFWDGEDPRRTNTDQHGLTRTGSFVRVSPCWSVLVRRGNFYLTLPAQCPSSAGPWRSRSRLGRRRQKPRRSATSLPSSRVKCRTWYGRT